ncbi:MAG: 4-carboxymuconolactone decarboxylase [Alphaproteobacteria bacterium]|jgi:4-carboxymuconolactone decarboxylase|nr:4-carboxymuconolactone decarboxylase [Alphaproteobacteria bacterium]
MRRHLVIAGAIFALGAVAGAAAIAIAAPDFVLRGGRFRPLSYAELNPAQKALADAEIASGRKSFDGPTNIYLRSPETAAASRPIQRYLRFESPTQHKLKEIVIMLTARFWGGQYVWYSHRKFALEAGLAPPFVDALAAGRRPDGMSADEAAVYDFFTELLATRQVSDTTFKTFVDRLGERAVVELVSLMGHYHGTTALFAVDGYPLPDGARQEIAKPM